MKLGISVVIIAISIAVFTMYDSKPNIEKQELKDTIVKKQKHYDEVFKEIKPIDKIQELSKKEKFDKLSLESSELIAKADKLIKDKNLKPINKNIDQDKLDKKIAHIQNKIEELR